MLTAEFDLDIAERVWKEQAWEEGLERGRGIGLEEGLERGLERGLEQGLERGLERGAQNKQLEILALMEQAENLEDFRRLQAHLKGAGGSTRTVQF